MKTFNVTFKTSIAIALKLDVPDDVTAEQIDSGELRDNIAEAVQDAYINNEFIGDFTDTLYLPESLKVEDVSTSWDGDIELDALKIEEEGAMS